MSELSDRELWNRLIDNDDWKASGELRWRLLMTRNGVEQLTRDRDQLRSLLSRLAAAAERFLPLAGAQELDDTLRLIEAVDMARASLKLGGPDPVPGGQPVAGKEGE